MKLTALEHIIKGRVTMKLRVDTFKGKLTMLGNSRVRERGTVYSMIEIGGETIEDVFCTDKMGNYLQRGLNHSDEVELFIAAKPSYMDAVFYRLKWPVLLIVPTVPLMFFSPIGGGALFLGAIIVLLFQVRGILEASHNRYNAIVGMTLDGQLYGNKTI